MEKHIEIYIKLKGVVFKIGKVVMSLGGELAWEWPKDCALWEDPQLIQFELQFVYLRKMPARSKQRLPERGLAYRSPVSRTY